VNGGCVYLYRAVDEKGHTVASHLSRTGDQTAARIFSGTGAERHGPAALRSTASAKPYGTAQNGQRNDFNYRWRTPVISAAASTRLQAREVPRCRNAGLELFRECRIVLPGIELIQKLKKGYYGVPFSFGIGSREIWCHVLVA
jgi:transposase-like protein